MKIAIFYVNELVETNKCERIKTLTQGSGMHVKISRYAKRVKGRKFSIQKPSVKINNTQKIKSY